MRTLLSKWHPNSKIGKFLKNVLIGAGIVLFLAFLILPFCRFSDAVTRICKWFWLGCAFINLDNFAEYKTAREQKIVCPVTALYIILTFVYLYTYWHLLSLPIVICGSIVVSIIEFTVSVSIYKTIRFTDKQKLVELPFKMIHGVQLGGLYICSLALFLLGIFESTLLLYIFGGIALLLLAVSILISLSNGLSAKKNVFNLIAFVVDVLSFLALVIYLIYIIPKEFATLQSIITTIVSAALGGALTLAGVAWTIKTSDKDRREEEKKKYKPYFDYIITLEYDLSQKRDHDPVCFFNINSDLEDGNKIYTYFKNSNNAILKIFGFKWKGIIHYPKFNTTILEGQRFLLFVVLPKESNPGKEETNLIVSDILGNQYEYALSLTKNTDKKGTQFYSVRNVQEIR